MAAALLVLLVACGGGTSTGSTGGDGDGARETQLTLRLGFFPNVTHATALVGIRSGTFANALGPGVYLKPKPFQAGPEAIEALFGDAVDAVYLGPNPTINAHVRSRGRALRIVAGATSAGTALVVRPGIAGAADLRGKKLATPQLGNTQDVALRSWLASHGLKTNTSGGGDASIMPQSNADTLASFRAGSIDGAWVPEPWASRLVLEGGGKVLVDERTLWPGGQFVTAHLVVRAQFLRKHPDTVRRLIEGHVRATAFINEEVTEARRVADDAVEAVTGTRLPEPVSETAWRNLTFTTDPLAPTLAESARHAQELGLLEDVDLRGIYDLRLLNDVLSSSGHARVAGL